MGLGGTPRGTTSQQTQRLTRDEQHSIPSRASEQADPCRPDWSEWYSILSSRRAEWSSR